MKKTRVTVNLDPQDHDALAAFAEVQGRSLSWVIAQSLKETVSQITRNDTGKRKGRRRAAPTLAEKEKLVAVATELLRREVEARGRRSATLACLDLFSGAGGLSIGLERAGFRPQLAIDIHVDSCETYSQAFPGVEVLGKPIQEVKFAAYESIDLIAGGPPCQPFSSGGKRLADADPRDMVPQFIRAVREARPRAFLMENVPGLFGPSHRDYLTPVLRQLEELGYHLAGSDVLNAADYGVPQKRRRAFLVGFLDGSPFDDRFSFPEPTHGPGRKQWHVPAGAVLSVDRIVGEANPSIVVYAKNPDLRPSPYDGHVYNGGGRPIDLEAPCHTILASAGGNKTHFIDTLGLVPKYHAYLKKAGKPKSGALKGARRITVEESALLQTFPKKMKFAGKRSSMYRQVGNAVPPLLAEAIGGRLKEALA